MSESAEAEDRLRSDQVLRKVVNSLYKGVLERPPETGGMADAIKSLLDAPNVCEVLSARSLQLDNHQRHEPVATMIVPILIDAPQVRYIGVGGPKRQIPESAK